MTSNMTNKSQRKKYTETQHGYTEARGQYVQGPIKGAHLGAEVGVDERGKGGPGREGGGG